MGLLRSKFPANVCVCRVHPAKAERLDALEPLRNLPVLLKHLLLRATHRPAPLPRAAGTELALALVVQVEHLVEVPQHVAHVRGAGGVPAAAGRTSGGDTGQEWIGAEAGVVTP